MYIRGKYFDMKLLVLARKKIDKVDEILGNGKKILKVYDTLKYDVIWYDVFSHEVYLPLKLLRCITPHRIVWNRTVQYAM